MSTEPAEVVSATVELTFTDGTTKRFELDNTERGRPIVLNLDVSNDVVDATPPNSAFWVRKPGDRRSVYIQMAGRGPIAAASAGPIVSKEPQQ